MKEKDIQRLFGKYLTENPKSIFRKMTSVFELKLIHAGKRVMINSSNPKSNTVKDHQLEGLRSAASGLYHKISDSPIYEGNKSRFTALKPFDCMYINADHAFIGICFYYPRKKKYLQLISLQDYERMRKDFAGKKSVTQDELMKYVCGSIELKKSYDISNVEHLTEEK